MSIYDLYVFKYLQFTINTKARVSGSADRESGEAAIAELEGRLAESRSEAEQAIADVQRLQTQSEAQGEEILVSSVMKELTQRSHDIVFEDGREMNLKGLDGSYTVHSVRWR